MNALVEKYGTDKVAVLGFICNQFGHQSNGNEGEFVNVLEHVRPGSGFKCADGVELFAKCDVNGATQLPLFKWMKERQRIPFGDDGDNKVSMPGPKPRLLATTSFSPRHSPRLLATTLATTRTSSPSHQHHLTASPSRYDLFLRQRATRRQGNGVQDNDALTQGDKSVLWSPIARGDIGWNFEKFLIGPDGKFVRRYSRYYLIDDIHADIDQLM